MNKTGIEWTEKTWNPVTGCTPISAGCANCYATRMAKRLAGRCGYPKDDPFAVTLHADRLEEPLRMRKPATIFVCSMGDLFHDEVPDEFIVKVFIAMSMRLDHRFVVLTKRAARMRDVATAAPWFGKMVRGRKGTQDHVCSYRVLPNVVFGTSIEDQVTADLRVPLLLQTPAATRILSIEPMLGQIDVGLSSATCTWCDRWSSRWVRLARPIGPDMPHLLANGQAENSVADVGVYRAHSNKHGALSVHTPNGLLGIMPNEFEALPSPDGVIVGGETGPKARPMHPEWVRDIRDQCAATGTPFFLKSWGEWVPGNQTSMSDEDLSHCRVYMLKTPSRHHPPGSGVTCNIGAFRVGKKNAGRELDGRTHDGLPEAMRATP